MDDEPAIRESLRYALEHDGLTCREASTLREANALVPAATLVLLDLVLPDGNGLDFLHNLRAIAPADVRVIVRTSRHPGKSGSRCSGLLPRSSAPQLRQTVNARLERTIKGNYRLTLDIAADRKGRGDLYDSSEFLVGRPVHVRLAAMLLALRRIEAHYRLEGFSQ